MAMALGRVALLAALIVLLLQFPAAAVRDPGSTRLSGVVRCSVTGKPLGGAIVRAAGREAVTDNAGRFEFPGLPWEPVLLRISRDGYRPTESQFRGAGGALKSDLRPSVAGAGALVIELEPVKLSDSNEAAVQVQTQARVPGPLPFYFPPSGTTLEPLDLKIVDDGIRASIQKSLFARMRAERFMRKRELMTDWFKPDDEWWSRFRASRQTEKEAKAAREREAVKNYYDWLVKAINNESRDDFVDRMLRERVMNNATYSGIPRELMLKSFDLDVLTRLSTMMEEEFIRDFLSRSGGIGHSLRLDPDNPSGWGDENPFSSPSARFPGVIAPPPKIVERAVAQADSEARVTAEKAAVPIIRGRVIEKEFGKPVIGAVVVVTDLEASRPEFFVTDYEGRFSGGEIRENRDYILEVFFPMMNNFAEKFRVRSMTGDKEVEVVLSRIR